MINCYSGLSRKDWTKLKLHFRRKTAFPLTHRDRSVFRRALDTSRLWAADNHNALRALPVSTTSWSSSSFVIEGNKLALVDIEQANAIDLIIAKTFFNEHPIFTYIEFMVRAAETCLSLADYQSALRISSICNERLHQYAKDRQTFPYIERPASMHDHIGEIVDSGITLAFVTGHEVGHLVPIDSGSVYPWVKDLYNKKENEPGRFDQRMNFVRFLKPECVQKFDSSGNHIGDVIQGIKMAKRFNLQKSHYIQEAHSDCFGLVAATQAAARTNVPAEQLLLFFFLILEVSEMLMSLKRILPRIPVFGEPSVVSYEPSSLGFRRFSLITAIRDIRSGKLAAPPGCRDYWKKLPRKNLSILIKSRDKGHFESASNRVTHVARAALCFGLSGHLPEAPSEKDILKQWGPLSGNVFFLYSYCKIPKSWLVMEILNFWQPNDRDEVLPIGFGSALRDVSAILHKRSDNPLSLTDCRAQSQLDDMLRRIRHPRTQVFRRVIFDLPVANI